MKTVAHTCCDITVRSNIVGTASSFSFNLFGNPASNFALFVNESAVKWSEQRTEFLHTWSGSSLKIKFIHSFLTLGSEGRQCKHCFFPQLGTAQRLVVFRAALSFGFCVDLRVLLSHKHYMCESVGGAKQEQTLIFFCGGGAYLHYYIIEWYIPQAVVLADCLQYKLFLDWRERFEFWNLQDVFIVQWPLICQKIKGILVSPFMTPLKQVVFWPNEGWK